MRLNVTAIAAHEWTKDSDPTIRMVPRVVAANFGYEAVRSDYSLYKSIYEFTPNQMHYWALQPRVHYREQMLLVIKSVRLLAPADTGIFNIRNQDFKGFQQGDPRIRQPMLYLHLYSDDGCVEFMFFEKDKNSPGVTQPEINRIIQTLRKTASAAATTPAIAQR